MNHSQFTQNLDQLMETYRTSEGNRFALFLGAGVNGGTWAKEHPACFSWPELVREVARHFHEENFIETVLRESGNDWVEAATKLFGSEDPELILERIDDAIYRDTFTHPDKRIERDAKHRVLEWKVFKNMETLRAVVAFSAAINDPAKRHSMRRNPKVGRILTTNYDFFFSAAWPRYTSMKKKWWPRTWKSRSTNPEGACPIIYLHGYLPYSKKGSRDVILLEEDYRDAYQEGKNADFAPRELKDAIENCNLIFIGFSFADQQVIDMLGDTDSSRTHFAFLHENDFLAIETATSLGVLPVRVRQWSELPDKLAQIYSEGITEKELERAHLSRLEYWRTLWNRQAPRT